MSRLSPHSNNNLQDIYIQGGSTSQDGIRVGNQGPAYNNVIRNIHGYGLGNVVHLNPASGSNNVADITILGSTCNGTGGCPGNNIKDELSGGATLTDASVGMYVVGEPVLGGTTTIGYSRFSTSPSSTSATWFSGTNGATGSCNTGSVYTCTSASNCTNTYTLWACDGGSWLGLK